MITEEWIFGQLAAAPFRPVAMAKSKFIHFHALSLRFSYTSRTAVGHLDEGLSGQGPGKHQGQQKTSDDHGFNW